MTGATERGKPPRLLMAVLRAEHWVGLLLILGSVALPLWWWFGGLADAVLERPMGLGATAFYVLAPLACGPLAVLVGAALLMERWRLVRFSEPPQLVFEGDPQDGWRLEDQDTLGERLLSARRRADEAGAGRR